jgi:uridine kinase
MKAALLISGYLRSYKNNIKYIQDEIIPNFDDVDVYLHITKNENKEDKYLNFIDEENDVKNIVSILKPKSLVIENNSNTNILKNQWSKLYKLNQLKIVNESIENKKYDLVIRYRFDLRIKTQDIFKSIESNKVYIPKDSKIDKSKLQNPNDNYLCDALAFGDSDTMDKYFDIFKYLDKYGNVSETSLYNYLKDWDIKYELIDINYDFILSSCNVFGICGDSGSGKTRLGNRLKEFFSNSFMLECDRYHKWERGNENWSKFTHLNPDANYISKMNEDIFNLKIGNSIYQVDYNHKNGKFTENKIIDPSENTIVCGLHSLYQENENLYDIKIFIDTDDVLKTKWKIERDVNERGHKLENVLAQIEKRREDYIKYIHPQKYKSDIVINFFPFNNEIGLRLLIKKQFNIDFLITKLKNKNVGFIYDNNDLEFNIIIFNKYIDIDFWENSTIPKFNDFYDYIIYIILNMKKL